MGPQATVNIVLGIDTNEHRNNQMRLGPFSLPKSDRRK